MMYLINPDEHRILENAGDRPPLGLLSIATKVSQEMPVKVFDMNHTLQDELMRNFSRDKPEYTGISVYTSPLYFEAVSLALMLKGNTRLIAGGYHATVMPETLTRYFDAVVQGEGEEAIKEAMEKDGIIKATEISSPNIPEIDRSFLNTSHYNMQMDGRTATMITSRGCPYACSFCGKMSRKVRFNPLKNAIGEIEQIEDLGYEKIYFLDDVFTLDKDRMRIILDKVHMPFRVTSRANLINDEVLNELKKHGCEWLSLGIESGDDYVLAKSNKGMTKYDNYKAVRGAGDLGIKVKGFFILGLPGESEESARRTIDFAKSLKEFGLKSADFYFLTPFPGTPIWEDPDKYGIEITNRNFTRYLEAGKGARCYVNTEHLKAGRIEELVQEAKSEWKN